MMPRGKGEGGGSGDVLPCMLPQMWQMWVSASQGRDTMSTMPVKPTAREADEMQVRVQIPDLGIDRPRRTKAKREARVGRSQSGAA